jgi:1-acyl-sn-glycerol-3-phosphate acyltransferase
MNTTRIACALRHYLWRTACALSGGLTVTGRWQHRGGCVLVANHGSHADTAVIMAALLPAAQPVFAAASDYWFDVPVRRFLDTSLAGALPVRRAEGGTYAALLAAAKPALAQGRTVVIYPEGTRTTDRTIGEFHSGAVHLARDCGVAVVPVALLGTRKCCRSTAHFHPRQWRRGWASRSTRTPSPPRSCDGGSSRCVTSTRSGSDTRGSHPGIFVRARNRYPYNGSCR